MTSTVKKADVRQDEILEAAQRLFAERGYSKTSVQAIIDKVGIAKGTFYHHFSSKTDLLDALVQRIANQLFAHVQPVLDDPDLDATARLLAYFQRIATFKAEQAGLLVDLTRALEEDANAQVKLHLAEVSIDTMVAGMVPIVEQGIDEGAFSCRHAGVTARHVLAVVHASRETWMKIMAPSGPSLVTREEIEAMVDAQQESIERILGAEPGSLPLLDRAVVDQFLAAAEARP